MGVDTVLALSSQGLYEVTLSSSPTGIRITVCGSGAERVVLALAATNDVPAGNTQHSSGSVSGGIGDTISMSSSPAADRASWPNISVRSRHAHARRVLTSRGPVPQRTPNRHQPLCSLAYGANPDHLAGYDSLSRWSLRFSTQNNTPYQRLHGAVPRPTRPALRFLRPLLPP